MEGLPREVPHEPLALVRQWLEDALAAEPVNPWAMALASVSPDGAPGVRYVLVKHLDVASGHLVFYTNYRSRKAADFADNPAAAGVLYWRRLGRQLRVDGRVERSPAEESDFYFATRPRGSQLNAWASIQSQPIATPDAMIERLEAREREFAAGARIPRPPEWGGFRLHIDAVELWVAGDDRFHERLRYERAASGWSHGWLQP